MENPISGDNPKTATPDIPDTGHDVVVDETPKTNGQPDRQTGHVEDIFKDIDPQKLPPELRPHLDNMVRTYREKTGKLSETVKSEVAKATEAYRQKAEWYDAAAKDDKLTKLINEYVQGLNKQNNDGNLPPELQEKLKKVDDLEQKMQYSEALTVINEFKETVDDKGNKLYPDFGKYSEIVIGSHPTAGEYTVLRAAVELAPGKTHQERLLNGYKAVDTLWKKAVEEGKKAGMGRLHEKARNGTFAPSSVNAGSVAPHRPKNALEAIQFAKQGLAVNSE